MEYLIGCSDINNNNKSTTGPAVKHNSQFGGEVWRATVEKCCALEVASKAKETKEVDAFNTNLQIEKIGAWDLVLGTLISISTTICRRSFINQVSSHQLLNLD
jgi:hypothetical protein